MWTVYYNNNIDPIIELGIYEDKRKAISIKRTFIYNSTKDKIYDSNESYITNRREYNLYTIIEKL